MKKQGTLLGLIVLSSIALSGCSTNSYAEQAETTATCSFGAALEWSSEPGPDTRRGALQDMIDIYSESLDKLPLDATSNPDLPLQLDRPRQEALISALTGAIDELQRIEESAKPDEAIEVNTVAATGIGGEFIVAPWTKGYRVTDYTVFGVPDRDGSCQKAQ